MAKKVEIIVTAKNATKAGARAVKVSLKSISDSAKRVGTAIKAAFSKLRGAFIATAVAAAAMAVTLKKAFEFERYTLQFKVLFGNMDEAKERIKDLQDFSAKTPFQFGDIAKASRALEIFTDGVMGGTESLKLVGDAAAATGTPINDLAFWVGRAYSAISSGRPFGEAAMRLQEMGILTGAARGEIEDMTKAGANNAAIWGVVQKALEKSEGGMETLSLSGEGLVSTLKDNLNLALAEIGLQFQDVAKDKIATLIVWLKKIREDGSIQKWTKGAVQFLTSVVDKVRSVIIAIKDMKNFLAGVGRFWGKVVGGKGISEGLKAMKAPAATKEPKAEIEAVAKQEEKSEIKKQTLKEKLAADLAKKDLAVREKNIKKLQDKEAKASKKVTDQERKERLKNQKAILSDRIAGLKTAIEESKKVATSTVADILSGQADQESQAALEEDEGKRATRLRAKLERMRGPSGIGGGKLSRKDQQFLDAFDTREGAREKLAEDEAALAEAEEEKKKMDSENNENLKLSREALEKIQTELAELLILK